MGAEVSHRAARLRFGRRGGCRVGLCTWGLPPLGSQALNPFEVSLQVSLEEENTLAATWDFGTQAHNGMGVCRVVSKPCRVMGDRSRQGKQKGIIQSGVGANPGGQKGTHPPPCSEGQA